MNTLEWQSSSGCRRMLGGSERNKTAFQARGGRGMLCRLLQAKRDCRRLCRRGRCSKTRERGGSVVFVCLFVCFYQLRAWEGFGRSTRHSIGS